MTRHRIALVLLCVGASQGALSQPVATAADQAAAPLIELSLVTSVTATNNGALAASGSEERDLLFSVRPSASVGHVGSGLRVKGDFGVDLITSKNETRDDQALPFANIRADATLIERTLFIDSLVDVHQVEKDAFAARVQQGAAEDAGRSMTLRLSPYLSQDISPDVSVLGRADVAWTRLSANRLLDAETRGFAARLTAMPRSVGGYVEMVGQDVHYPNADTNDWRSYMATVGPTVSVASEVVVGAIAGVERTTTALSTHTDGVGGFSLVWLPTQRTDVSLQATHRYFGNGWNVTLQHRTPSVSMALRAIREPLLPGTSLVGGGGTVTTFLDSILTTRFPDANQRQRLVSDLVATRGLQTALQGTAGTPGNYAQLGKGAEVTVVWLSPRNALTMSAYQQVVTLLTRTDGAPAFSGSGEQDTRQVGMTAGFNRRLTPLISVDLTGRWSRVEGLASRAGDMTRESTYRLSFARNLALRTSVALGAGYRQLETNVATQPSFDETTAFVVLAHRF